MQPTGHAAVLSVLASKSHMGVNAATLSHPAGHEAVPSVPESRSHAGVCAPTNVHPAGQSPVSFVLSSRSQVVTPSAAVPVQESGTSVAVPEQVAATSLAEPEQLALDAVLRHVDLLRLSSAEISAVIHASRCVAAQLSSTGAV